MTLKRRRVTLVHLRTLDEGPALSPGDIARILSDSPSADKLRDEIRAGRLRAVVMAGTDEHRVRYLVPFLEAKRYLLQLGFLEAA